MKSLNKEIKNQFTSIIGELYDDLEYSYLVVNYLDGSVYEKFDKDSIEDEDNVDWFKIFPETKLEDVLEYFQTEYIYFMQNNLIYGS